MINLLCVNVVIAILQRNSTVKTKGAFLSNGVEGERDGMQIGWDGMMVSVDLSSPAALRGSGLVPRTRLQPG